MTSIASDRPYHLLRAPHNALYSGCYRGMMVRFETARPERNGTEVDGSSVA